MTDEQIKEIAEYDSRINKLRRFYSEMALSISKKIRKLKTRVPNYTQVNELLDLYEAEQIPVENFISEVASLLNESVEAKVH